VWDLIKTNFPNLTDWDILCFASQYIAMQSLNWMWLQEPAKDLAKLVYTAHYLDKDTNVDTGLHKSILQSGTVQDSSGTATSGTDRTDEAGSKV
jgi:hypothetical protein